MLLSLLFQYSMDWTSFWLIGRDLTLVGSQIKLVRLHPTFSFLVISGSWLIPSPVQSARDQSRRTKGVCTWLVHHHVNLSSAGKTFAPILDCSFLKFTTFYALSMWDQRKRIYVYEWTWALFRQGYFLGHSLVQGLTLFFFWYISSSRRYWIYLFWSISCGYQKVLTHSVIWYPIGCVLVHGQTMVKGLVDFMRVIAMSQQSKRAWWVFPYLVCVLFFFILIFEFGL